MGGRMSRSPEPRLPATIRGVRLGTRSLAFVFIGKRCLVGLILLFENVFFRGGRVFRLHARTVFDNIGLTDHFPGMHRGPLRGASIRDRRHLSFVCILRCFLWDAC